ncbi:MAG: hypothetical protein F6K42_25820 [Leptolyngbya sp. SIO1D8]|nr:hypothetical protein [Leptolyngbya sp. SIO1D8]
MTLSIALPDSVPTPKFQLFQRVRYYYTAQKQSQGTITGFGYISPAAALAEGLGSYGWQSLFALNRASINLSRNWWANSLRGSSWLNPTLRG